MGGSWRHPGMRGLRLGPQGPVPPAVKGLIAANCIVYLLQLIGGDRFTWEFALVPALVGHGEVWRLFTYQFLHGGLMHLGLNMLMLWMFGSELEQRWGMRFFLKYYFLCAVGGGVAFWLVRYGTWVPSVGASGAIYGILLAYGMWFPNREVYLWFLFPIRVRWLVAFLILLEFTQTMASTGTGIAHAAHMGGMAVGYAYLRWWGVRGFGFKVPRTAEIKRAYYRWRFRRLQRKRLGGGGGGPTYH